MKTILPFGFLCGTFAFLINPQPSFSKQIWLECVDEVINGISFSKSPNTTSIINLDYTKERFELMTRNYAIQGRANIFAKVIQFERVIAPESNFPLRQVWEINRTDLSFTVSAEGVISTGTCKVVPAPAGKNLI